jgi:hypothetical protein
MAHKEPYKTGGFHRQRWGPHLLGIERRLSDKTGGVIFWVLTAGWNTKLPAAQVSRY